MNLTLIKNIYNTTVSILKSRKKPVEEKQQDSFNTTNAFNPAENYGRAQVELDRRMSAEELREETLRKMDARIDVKSIANTAHFDRAVEVLKKEHKSAIKRDFKNTETPAKTEEKTRVRSHGVNIAINSNNDEYDNYLKMLDLGFSLSDINAISSVKDRNEKIEELINLAKNGKINSDCLELFILNDEKERMESLDFAEKILSGLSFEEREKIRFEYNSFEIPFCLKAIYKTDGENLLDGNDFGTEVTHKLTIEDDKSIIQRIEKYPDGNIISSYPNSGVSFESKIIETGNIFTQNLSSQIEILPDKNGEPVEIIHRKKSDIMPEVFEITSYKLSNYDEKRDLIEEIKSGTLEGGEQISYVKNNEDGSLSYFENIKINGSTIQRTYTLKPDKQSYDYNFTITEENGEKILDNSISYEVLSDTKTKATVNSKEFSAEFDDKTQTVTILSNNKETEINIAEKTDGDQRLWQAAKHLPPNLILALKSLEHWEYDKDAAISHKENKLLSYDNLSTNAHEIGHKKDFEGGITKDEKLLEIYNEEMANFDKHFTDVAGRDYIKYFAGGNRGIVSPTGGFFGIQEFVAEANVTFTTVGQTNPELNSRTQFLVQNFPKTLAYIAGKLG